MSNEIHGILFSNVQPVSGGAYQSAPRDEESFLREVVTPIYEVLRKVPRFVNFFKTSFGGEAVFNAIFKKVFILIE